jgi:hypothetical protein
MISEYFIRERIGKLYDELDCVQAEMEEFKGMFYLEDPEYERLSMIHDFLLEKIDLLWWVLGDE